MKETDAISSASSASSAYNNLLMDSARDVKAALEEFKAAEEKLKSAKDTALLIMKSSDTEKVDADGVKISFVKEGLTKSTNLETVKTELLAKGVMPDVLAGAFKAAETSKLRKAYLKCSLV